MSKVPVCLYVLWHPSCEDGRELAKTVYDWFHAPSEELHRAGLGLPVYYRFEAESEETSRPREIRLDQASINVIIPLVDDHMVADPGWRAYLDEYARPEGDSVAMVYPVALHSSAYRLPPPIRRVNFLRVEGSLEQRAVQLRRQLTEVLSRHLHSRLAFGTAPDAQSLAKAPPITVFISHAKRDGVGIAGSLRDEIFGYGQIKAFYDENDLPIGAVFENVLKDAASGKGTAAMLSVITDFYASRPWCRAEVRLARRPRREPKIEGETAKSEGEELWLDRWFIQPLVAVIALTEKRTRGVPEIGNAPIIQWRESAITEILDLLMLESLLFAFHRLSALAIAPADGRHVISWVPDLQTLLELQHASMSSVKEVIYPGHGLPQDELKTYRRLLGDLSLKTFEEARD